MRHKTQPSRGLGERSHGTHRRAGNSYQGQCSRRTSQCKEILGLSVSEWVEEQTGVTPHGSIGPRLWQRFCTAVQVLPEQQHGFGIPLNGDETIAVPVL